MKKAFLLALLFCVEIAACTQRSNNTTSIAGTLPDGLTPEWVDIYIWEAQGDGGIASRVISVPVKEGRFEAEIPTCTTELSHVQVGHRPISFVADGTSLTADFETGIVKSSGRKGIHNRYLKYRKAQEKLSNMISKKCEPLNLRHELGEDVGNESLALKREYDSLHNATILSAVMTNSDNVVATVAIKDLGLSDPVMLEECLGLLSDEMKKTSIAIAMRQRLDARSRISDGIKPNEPHNTQGLEIPSDIQ